MLNRRTLVTSLLGASSLSLIGCSGLNDKAPWGGGGATQPEPLPGSEGGGSAIGTGAVKVGLILPLTATGSAGDVARNLRNAAELALAEFAGNDLSIFVRDDGGTAQGAVAAAKTLLSEGVELILGPLFSESVRQVGVVAKAANKPVVAFSTDPSVASQGVYLLSFLTDSAVNRAVRYAISQGKRSFAGLVSSDPSGQLAQGSFQQAVASNGARVMGIERFTSAQDVGAGAVKLKGIMNSIDALFVPDPLDGAALNALKSAGFDLNKLMVVGAGQWDGNAGAAAAAPNAIYGAADPTGFRAFAGRYRAKFNQDPVRIASVAYDAVSLAAGLSKAYGASRFAANSLTSASGFTGVDGLFRFKTNGLNERGLVVLKASGGVVSPANKAFS